MLCDVSVAVLGFVIIAISVCEASPTSEALDDFSSHNGLLRERRNSQDPSLEALQDAIKNIYRRMESKELSNEKGGKKDKDDEKPNDLEKSEEESEAPVKEPLDKDAASDDREAGGQGDGDGGGGYRGSGEGYAATQGIAPSANDGEDYGADSGQVQPKHSKES